MEFFAQAELFSRPSILARPELVPESRGIYAWFFREIPPLVPTDSCFTRDVLTLLYVGISPKNANSHQNLRKRIFNHYRGNAKGSTLRLTLGVLLTATSNHPLRRVGSGHQMTFTREGELWLNDWLERNAFVCWVEHQEPWLAEDDFIQSHSLPLNIQGNRHHPYCSTLRHLRKEARRFANKMPIHNEVG